jgi:hypothetical protein
MKLEALKKSPPWEWPPNAGKLILQVLQDTKATDTERTLAAEFAGDPVVVESILVEALLEIIANPDETVRFRSGCTMALGPVLELLDMGDLDDDEELRRCASQIPEILQPLHFDTNAPDILRRRAIETSVRYEQDWHAKAITGALDSGKTDWRRTAVFAMRFVPGFEKQILEALSSEDEDTEFQAVCAAEVWQIDAAWDHVVNLACSAATEKYLRMAALEAMSSIRLTEAIRILMEMDDFEDDDLLDIVNEILRMEPEL